MIVLLYLFTIILIIHQETNQPTFFSFYRYIRGKTKQTKKEKHDTRQVLGASWDFKEEEEQKKEGRKTNINLQWLYSCGEEKEEEAETI